MHLLSASSSQKLKLLHKNEYFEGLDKDLLNQIAAHMQLREYERGEALFWEGDPCAGLHIIEQGFVKLYRLSPQGRQYIVRVLQEGDTCNEVPTFDGGTNPVNVEALETTRVWVIQPEILGHISYDLAVEAAVNLMIPFPLDKDESKPAQDLRTIAQKVLEIAKIPVNTFEIEAKPAPVDQDIEDWDSLWQRTPA